MTMIIVILLVIAIIGFAVYKKNIKAKESTSKESPPPAPRPETSPDQEYTDILNSLLSLNILLRKDNALSNELTQKIEAIIDDLMVITPSMMERYPGDTLTYEIKKIGKTHLFKTVKEYLDLSLESRKNQLDIFKKTIESLHDVSNRSRDIVEKNETAEFKTMANFLAGKFS
jgi:3',5'-cyclic AMP phosphodiesterase CpdA